MPTPTQIKARMNNDTRSTAAASVATVARVDETLSAELASTLTTNVGTLTDTPSINPNDGTPPVNKAPIVVDEWINVVAGQPMSAHQSVLLVNDRDTDGGTLSIAELGNPSHGTLTKAADGTLTYVADVTYSGADSFTYKVSDGQGGFTWGTVHITVQAPTGGNKPPVVVDEAVNVRGSTPVSAHESALLANDSDPEGGALTVRNISMPSHGTLIRAADGTLTYTAQAGYTGNDSFTYEVVDPQGAFTVGTVHLCVLPARLSITITDVRDDVGPVQGTVLDEGSTDDRRPALQGRTEAGALVDVYDGTTKLGQVTADANGNWSFTPTTDLGDGRHDFKATATAVDGQTAQSNEWSVIVDCSTTPPALPAPVVVIGEDTNNDGLISRAENTGRADAIVTLPQGAKAGDTLIVTDQGGAEQRKVLTAADITAGTVTFTDGFAMPADGQRLTLTAQIRTSEGVLSERGTDTALVDTTAPGAPTITITTDTDNNGRISQGELNAAGGVDLRVDLPASAKAGDTLIVVDQDGHKVEVTLSAAQIAAGSVSFDNAFPTPAHNATLTVTATIKDPAGNVSQPGTDSALIDCPPPPVLPAPVVVIGEDLNNDGLISRAENTGRADAIVTLPQGAKAGDTLIVTDQGGAEQRKVLTAADITAGTVTFTDGFAMPADGQRLTLTAQIRTSEGVLSERGTDTALVDTTAPGAPTITITTDSDNSGRINQGELDAAGGIDLRVDLPASARAGDKLIVVDQDGHKVEVTLSAAQIAAGSVSFDNAFPTPAQNATLTVTATIKDPAGNVSQPGTDSALIDCPPPPVLPAPVVVIGEDLNNDGLISRAENTGRADAIVTLPQGAKAGDTLIVTDQGGAEQRKVLTAADITAGTVTFTDGFAMPADGQRLTLSAQIRTSEGVLSEKGTDTALVDTSAPGNPIITITTDGDNNGRINQGELDAAGGIDLRVDLPASARAGDTLTVLDQSGRKIEITLTAAHIAAQAVNFDNAFPAPAQGSTLTVTATIKDPAGNVSQPSSDSALIDTSTPAVPAPIVTIANDANNDGLLNAAEAQGRADIVVDLDPIVKAGDVVYIEDQAGNLLGRPLTAAEAAAHQITFTDAFAFPAEGQTLRVESYIRTAGGLLSPRANDQAVIDTTGTGNPTITIETDVNNDGKISQAEFTTAGGNDLRVGLPVTARAGDILTITDQDGHRIQRPLTAAEIAVGSVFLDNAFPSPGDGRTLTVSATLTDPAGNVSDTAQDSAVMTLTAPTVTITIVDDKDNDGVITRNEVGNATRVDIRLDLPASVQAGDRVEVTDNQGNGVSKTVSAADVAARQITFLDAFPLPASGDSIVVTAKVTDTAGNVSPLSRDEARFDGNYLPTGTDDVNTVRGFATPMASILAMNQDSGTMVPAGQTWVTTDGDAGRAVFGQLSSLMVAGMTVQISSSDHPGQWIDAVVSSDGLHWTAVDNTTHSADWSYTARVLNTDGSVLTTSVAQAVDYRDAASGAPSIDSFGTQVGNSSIALGAETGDQTLVINGRASGGAASAGHTIEVFANGISHPVGTAVVKADGTWSLDLTGTTLKDGSYNFYARDRDGGEWSNKATVEIAPPNGSVENWANWGPSSGYSLTAPQPTGTIQTREGAVQVTSQVTGDGWRGVMPANNLVAANLQGLFPGGSADGNEGNGLYVYSQGVMTLSFNKPITDPNLLFFGPDGTMTIRAWDENGNVFQPSLSLVANANANGAGLGAITNNSFIGQSGQGVIEVEGRITKIEISQTGNRGDYEYYVQMGQPAARDGASYGTDDGSIVAGTPSSIDNSGDDVRSFATQAELDAALAAGNVEGGAGIDTLRLTGNGMRLDLTLHSSTPGVAQDVNNFERFDLVAGSGRNSLVMSVNDVLAQGQTNAFTVNGRTQVMVNGDGSDSLSLTHLLDNGGDTGNWAAAGTVLVNGTTYNVFNHSSLAAQVLVNQGVQVQIPVDPGSPAATTNYPQVSGQVLTNDDDPDGPEDQLRVAGVDNNPGVTPGENVGTRIEGTYGHLTLNADGTYTYVADKSAGLTTPQQDVFYYLPKDGQGAYAEQPVKLTITVDPALANVTSVSSPDIVTEGQDLIFTVGTSASPLATTMSLEVLSGTGTAGVDTTTPLQVNFGNGWVNVVGNQVSVPAGTTSYQVKVPTFDDTTIETRETVFLKVTSTTGSTAQGTGTILDNDLLGNTVQGTEDTPIALTWTHFNLNNLPGATKLQITELPVDGKLEYNDNGTWRATTLNQEFSKAEIDAGKLRFSPDANESGSDAYNANGTGNKVNDYAQIRYTAFDQQNLPYTGGKLIVDIAPIADLGTLALVATGSGTSQHLYTFSLSGASPDTDGSERTRIAVKWVDKGMNVIDGATGTTTLAVKDANGLVWIDPDDRILLTNVATGNGCEYSSSIEYAVFREEVNSAGQILDVASSAYKTASQYYYSPLVLDLNGDGVQTASIEHGVAFDLNADGKKEQTGWTDGKDGLLVLDRDGNGRIDSGAELFGDATTRLDGSRATDGFAALSDLDSNGDGVISAADAQFANLQVWVDGNQDGLTQAGELLSLGAVGVVSMNLAAQETEVIQNGNVIGLTSSYTKADGSTHELSDVWFQSRALSEAGDATLDAKDLLASDPLAELCAGGDPKGCAVAVAPDVAAQLVNHAVPGRVSFEHWDEPSHAML